MDLDDLLTRYDEQLRTDAEVADVEEVARLGPLYLATIPARNRGFITYRDLAGLSGPALDDLVAAAATHYQADPRVTNVEWKTRGHDQPANLLDRLAHHGFVAEEPETVMIGDAQRMLAVDPGLPDGYRLEQASSPERVREFELLAAHVFGDDDSTAVTEELVDRWQRQPGSFQIWAVRDASGAVVCTGRLEPVPGTDFAGLWGGACDEQHRGKGLYRALTAERARFALRHGYSLLQSDCTEYSRPILERAGMQAVTTTTPCVWRRG